MLYLLFGKKLFVKREFSAKFGYAGFYFICAVFIIKGNSCNKCKLFISLRLKALTSIQKYITIIL